MSLKSYMGELRSQAAEALATAPKGSHHWQGDELVFPTRDGDGFDVTLQPDAQGILAYTDVAFHEHCGGEPHEAVQQALGLARDLLSPDMRIRERRAGHSGYRWLLERRDGEEWIVESTTGLLFWNYFAARTERVYQNSQLPGRLSGDGAGAANGA